MPEVCDLSSKSCVPCQGGVPTLDADAINTLSRSIEGWEVVDQHHLSKTFLFDDFKGALDWVNILGEIAETEGHHPDIYLAWGKVRVDIWTHKVDGLTESDFILAAKCDAVL